MFRIAISLLVIGLFGGISNAQEIQVVSTYSGRIGGEQLKTLTGNKGFYAFKGIPYAKPPVGELRFQPPVPVESWSDIRNTTEEGDVCPQIDQFSGEVTGNEDCLTLNVYTPVVDLRNVTTKLATMVFIYGGGFLRGSKNSHLYGPDRMIDQNVILVSMNYRLGPFGFLSLNDARAPGNVGLKDQNLALQWVNRNIEKFGGDPNNVTLVGESAGGASVQLHMLSDMSNGLFQRSIAQSGTPLSTKSPQDAERAAYKLVAALGTLTIDKEEAYNTLMAANTTDIVMAASTISNLLNPLFVPMVEKRGVSPDNATFLSECPIRKLATGNYNHMPHILGRNDKEALTFTQSLDQLVERLNNSVNTMGNTFPISLLPSSIRAVLRDGLSNVTEQIIDGVINSASKLLFNAPIEVVQQMMAKTSGDPIYYYDFTYVPEHPVHTVLYNATRYGVGHTDELPMIFYMPIVNNSTDPNHPDNKMSHVMSCYWANFIKTGNPTPPEANDQCSGARWEDSRPKGRMMNVTSIPNMIPRQTDIETDVFAAFTRIASYLTTGCSSIIPILH